MSRIEVAVAAPLLHTLSYSFDLDVESHPVGKRVLVPLGRQRITGYVIALLPEEDVSYRILPVLRFLDREPLFPENMVPFFRWIADYYHHPLGEVIKTALPGGLNSRNRKTLQLTAAGKSHPPSWNDPDLPEPPWFSELLKKTKLTPSRSKSVLGDRTYKGVIAELLGNGLLCVVDSIDSARVSEKRERCCSLNTDMELPVSIEGKEGRAALKSCAVQNENDPLSVPLVRTLFHLSVLMKEQGEQAVAVKDLRKVYGSSAKALPELEKRGLVTSSLRRIYRNPFGEALPFFDKPDILTPEQVEVLGQIIPAILEKQYSPFLLHGVTGCGKTEVYLRAAEETLAGGRDVLVLVPEIALATQLESHFVSRFQDRVVILHSGLSPGQRFDQWSIAARGGGKVVIGARSAVFAPLPDPGFIIVDEEHDGGYKQDDGLRYHGRDLAVLRARYNSAVVVLGSGTPTITSYAAAASKKYTLLKMLHRVENRRLPEVTVVDLRDKQSKERGKAIGKQLAEELGRNLENTQQSILLLNRRGFSSIYLCRDCGEPVRCLHCHVSLTYHKKKAKLVCHYCGYVLHHNTLCSSCNSDQLVPVGFGTERVEQEIVELFPHARVARIDSDTSSDRKKFLALLKKMHGLEIDILIGTQMIAKGHDFPNVTLVGVVWADGGLSMPDYRAAERTYQLLSQVTGRAGRGEKPGRVIVQTLRPEHYAIELARKHDYAGLYEREMEIRKNPMFPPYLRLVNIKISGSKEAQVQQTAGKIAELCRQQKQKGFAVLGPAPAPIDRLRDRYRWQILLKGQQTAVLHERCREILAGQAGLVRGDVRIALDIDPESMM